MPIIRNPITEDLMTEAIVARFWAKVAKRQDGHWIYAGWDDGRGRPRFEPKQGSKVSAGRYAWAITHGVLAVQSRVERACDEKRCVNPQHYLIDARPGANARPGAKVADLIREAIVDATADACIEWTGRLDRDGYGSVRFDGHATGAHRASWIIANGAVPNGLVIDHTCRNRACINPLHLEPVTNAENIKRGSRGILKTHCAKGHPYSGDNLIIRPGRRVCRECQRVAAKAFKKRRRLASS